MMGCWAYGRKSGISSLGMLLLWWMASAIAESEDQEMIMLPEPSRTSDVTVEQALQARRSRRVFQAAPVNLAQLGQLLWAVQGVNSSDGRRTAPSAGALYPLEVYLVAGNVEGLNPGIYSYDTPRHRLLPVAPGDRRKQLADAALGQEWLARAPLVLVIAAIYERTTIKYGERGIRYVHMEAGHAAQNVALQALSLGLGTTTVGAFSDPGVSRIVELSEDERPLYLLPIGY